MRNWVNDKRAARKDDIIDPVIHQFKFDECISLQCRTRWLQKSNIYGPFSNYDQYYAGNSMQTVLENLQKSPRSNLSHENTRVS